jgi:hypothetical protein
VHANLIIHSNSSDVRLGIEVYFAEVGWEMKAASKNVPFPGGAKLIQSG